MIDRKKIAEKLRKIAEDCAISGSIAVNKTNAALYAAADELDPPEPKPLLADAKVGDLCQRRDEKWVQIETLCSLGGMPWICYEIGGLRYINNGEQLNTKDRNLDIISTEPLAPEGSAEWAWQMLKLGRMVTSVPTLHHYEHNIKTSRVTCVTNHSGFRHSDCSIDTWGEGRSGETGWQLYEPGPVTERCGGCGDIMYDGICKSGMCENVKPGPEPEYPAINGYNRYDYIPVEGIRQPKLEPKFKVGDWVRLTDRTQCCLTRCLNADTGHWFARKADNSEVSVWEKYSTRVIASKLKPSEVIVKIGCLSGTVEKAYGEEKGTFILRGLSGQRNVLWLSMLDAPTRSLVEKLLKAQEDK